jgi:aspartyl aminopeptidase
MTKKSYAPSLIDFIENSPTPYHACEEIKKWAHSYSAEELDEKNSWEIKRENLYLVQRGGSLIAFKMPKGKIESFRITAAHTDSPCLQVKPALEVVKEGLRLIPLEVYGSPILEHWKNRPLGIAGKVAGRKGSVLKEVLVNLPSSFIIPDIAIHLNKEGKSSTDPSLWLLAGTEKNDPPLQEILLKETSLDEILAFELFAYPQNASALIGTSQTILSTWRFDNLGSVYACSHALFEAKPHPSALQIAVFWNHEEVGSMSAEGACSFLLPQITARIFASSHLLQESLPQTWAKSTFLSVDQAHASHPGFSDRRDSDHLVSLGGGVVFKHNAKKRYVTDIALLASLKHLCIKKGFSYQTFAARNDMPCGSTVGPLMSVLGARGVDLGVAQLSMHSSMEIAHLKDQEQMAVLLQEYYEQKD